MPAMAAANPNEIGFWLLGAIAVLTGFSLFRFVIFGIPTMLGGWYQSNKKSWLYTLMSGRRDSAGMFYLM